MAQCLLLRHVTLNSKCNSDDVCYFSLYFNVFLDLVSMYVPYIRYDLPSLVPVLYIPILKCTLKQRFKLECMYFQQKWLQAKIGFAHQWFMKCSTTYIGKKHIYTTNKNLSFLFLVHTICKKWRNVVNCKPEIELFFM